MIRVLIVDDSSVVRRVLSETLSRQPDMEVVGTAADPYVAREMIVQHHPDVVTLDVEMPRMDGLSFLAKLMKHHPLPVVLVSSIAQPNSATAIRALELGAVEVLAKPAGDPSNPNVIRPLLRAIRAAAAARSLSRPAPAPDPYAGIALPNLTGFLAGQKILGIGASTGGTIALEAILSRLPANTSGTVVVQHMPEFFTGAFAERLNSVCPMEIREAKDGDPITQGVALIAPGNRHMKVVGEGGHYLARLTDGPTVNHHRPSVDVLFDSVAKNVGPGSVGVILTGMGGDGSRGLLAMHERGALTLAQDEATSVVFGMPREAIRLGAADKVVPLPLIPSAITHALQEPLRRVA